jgi:uncharacterized protein (TIGR01777 family)
MRVTVTGATGLIGRALVAALRDRGDAVVALSRDPARARAVLGAAVEVHRWADPELEAPPAPALEGSDAVVHLLGEPIAQRWTAAVKRRIRDSRVLATRRLVGALETVSLERRPGVLVSQSAVGYYGPRGDEELDESAPAGVDFLADVTAEWEAAALEPQVARRVVVTRTGVVLSARGGALAQMLPPFRLGLGGPVGGGRQYVSWIHLEDVVGALVHLLDDERAAGPVNLTAPAPVTNAELARALGRELRRPAVVPVPALALRLLYGEMAMVVLTGQRALPRRLLELGYRFRYPELAGALRSVLGHAR